MASPRTIGYGPIWLMGATGSFNHFASISAELNWSSGVDTRGCTPLPLPPHIKWRIKEEREGEREGGWFAGVNEVWQWLWQIDLSSFPFLRVLKGGILPRIDSTCYRCFSKKHNKYRVRIVWQNTSNIFFLKLSTLSLPFNHNCLTDCRA